jgi:hypothetical protein
MKCPDSSDLEGVSIIVFNYASSIYFTTCEIWKEFDYDAKEMIWPIGLMEGNQSRKEKKAI